MAEPCMVLADRRWNWICRTQLGVVRATSFFMPCLPIAIMVKYTIDKLCGGVKMEEKKIGRPRKFEGTESQRRQKANAVYYKKTFKQLNIRIPFALWEKVQADAKAKKLSVRRFVIKKLEE